MPPSTAPDATSRCRWCARMRSPGSRSATKDRSGRSRAHLRPIRARFTGGELRGPGAGPLPGSAGGAGARGDHLGRQRPREGGDVPPPAAARRGGGGGGWGVEVPFHPHVLKTLREVANAIRYVLENFRHHLREDVAPEGVGGTTGPAQARRSAPLEHGSCERPAASPEALRGRLLG